MDFQTFVKKHYFWILFGVAILLVPIGWWMGTSSLAAKTQDRIKEIDGAIAGIPKPKSNPQEFPNMVWVGNLKEVNDKRTRHHYKGAKTLHELQKGIMKWPDAVAHVMQDVPFFEDGKGVAANRARSTYNDIYIQEARSVYELVRPIKQNRTTGEYEGLVQFKFLERDEGGANNGASGSGAGIAAPMGSGGMGSGGDGTAGGVTASGTFPRVPDSTWAARPPTFREMWKAQLDLWLLASLLKSINRVNKARDAKTIHDAAIREIASISLHGGNRKALMEARSGEQQGGNSEDGSGSPSTGPMGASAGSGNSGNAGSGLMSGRPGNGSGNDGNATGGPGGTGATGDIALPSPPEIFGPTQSETDGKDGDSNEGSGDGTESPNYGSGSGSGPMASGTSAGGGAGATNGAAVSPWVDNDPEMPFKTRGFMMKLLMKRSDVSLLIQELTDANVTRFPIEILWLSGVDKDIDHSGDKIRIRYGGGAGVAGSPNYGSGPMNMGDSGASALPPSQPMGSGVGSGRFGGGPTGPTTGMGGGSNTGGNALPYQSALEDSSLGYIVIAGVMTIYQEPKKPEVDPNAANNTAANNGDGNAQTGTADGSKTGNPDTKQPGKTPKFIDPAKKNTPTTGGKTANPKTAPKQNGGTKQPAFRGGDVQKSPTKKPAGNKNQTPSKPTGTKAGQ